MSSLVPVLGKDPRFVRAGKAAAKARWGGRRVLRLREMDPSLVSSFLALAADNEAAIDERERQRAQRYRGTLVNLIEQADAARAQRGDHEQEQRERGPILDDQAQ
jgi:hypothetical protein